MKLLRFFGAIGIGIGVFLFSLAPAAILFGIVAGIIFWYSTETSKDKN